MTNPVHIEEFLVQYGTQIEPSLRTYIRELFNSRVMIELAEAVLQRMYWGDEPETDQRIRELAAHLPYPVVEALGNDLLDMAQAMAGLFCPDESDNVIVHQLQELNPDQIVLIRDYALMFPRLVAGTINLVRRLPEDKEAQQAMLAVNLSAPLIASMSPAHRFMLFGYFVGRAAVKPSFLEAARRMREMRAASVLNAIAKTDNPMAITTEQMETILHTVGVSEQGRRLWFTTTT